MRTTGLNTNFRLTGTQLIIEKEGKLFYGTDLTNSHKTPSVPDYVIGIVDSNALWQWSRDRRVSRHADLRYGIRIEVVSHTKPREVSKRNQKPTRGAKQHPAVSCSILHTDSVTSRPKDPLQSNGRQPEGKTSKSALKPYRYDIFADYLLDQHPEHNMDANATSTNTNTIAIINLLPKKLQNTKPPPTYKNQPPVTPRRSEKQIPECFPG
ncbi:hypothetical protein WN51_06777 [Melipona quadrifasciata]|uniref:Uncharacterized protein n=1 Tax=Melipona quadrifasciata TaxID=166423 RepID=A0A0M8ZTS0_9HYME|nr:hypothetical protein WN51_06777 [Melipona quadrifasciata]